MDSIKLFLESPDFLQTIVAETNTNSETARQLVAGLSDDQLNWKPSSKEWSIAQCLNHLTVAAGKFDPYFAKAITHGRTRQPVTGKLLYRPSIMGGLLIKQVVPETTRKLNAPKIFRPADTSAIHDA